MTAPDISPAPSENGGVPADEPEVEGGPPRIEITFPRFDVHAGRSNSKRVRPPGDRSFEYAEVRDVNAVGMYAAQCALQAVGTVNNAMFGYYRDQLQQLANNVAIAITDSINEYDRLRRANVWHRRLRRWVASAFAPAPPKGLPKDPAITARQFALPGDVRDVPAPEPPAEER